MADYNIVPLISVKTKISQQRMQATAERSDRPSVSERANQDVSAMRDDSVLDKCLQPIDEPAVSKYLPGLVDSGDPSLFHSKEGPGMSVARAVVPQVTLT